MNYPAPYDSTMLNIGEEKQYFFDDLVIESVENVSRNWHQPQKSPESPVIKKDQPWEHLTYFTANAGHVLYDPDEEIFKCWYTDWDKPEIRSGEPAIGQSVFRTLYAESEDGIQWRKPILGVEEIDGYPTNVTVPDGYNLGPVRDPHEPDPQKRYKALYTRFVPGGDVADKYALVSPDGRQWRVLEERPQFGRQGAQLDDVLILNYNPHGRYFVLNTRHYDMYAVARNLSNPVVGHWTLPYYPADWRRMNKRRVWQAESADMIHWGEPYPILVPDAQSAELDETFYCFVQYPMGDVTLGFLNIYNYVSNTMRIRLVYSRDGKTWYHLKRGQPFLEPGGEGTWDAYMVTMSSPPLTVGDELWIYHGGSSNHHDWWITGAREGLSVPEAHDISQVNYALGLAKLRLDGFVSLSANAVRPGIFITRPIISSGNKLVINARCGTGGSLAAEVVDINDRVLPGFSRSECDVFTGDAVRHVVSWQGRTDIPVKATERAEYPGPEIERFRKIRFYMNNVDLYSFQLASSPE